jgi:transcriptional regulator with XRE-family HTH domain
MSTEKHIPDHRRWLRTELREARRRAGFTQRQVASEMDWSPSKMLRIESGSVGISTTDLQALLRYYQVADHRRTELVDLIRKNR